MELYKYAKEQLEIRLDEESSSQAAACITNYVFRFGHVNSQHLAVEGLVNTCKAERVNIFDSLGDTFKTNATGVLILLGAAWRVDLDKFKAHILLLASEGFVKTGSSTPNVAQELPNDSLAYFYEVLSLDATGA